MTNRYYMRGDIVWARIDVKTSKHIQQGNRPFVIIQNDVGNYFSTTTIVAPLTTKLKKQNQPTHVIIEGCNALGRDSIVLLEQIFTIDKDMISQYAGSLNKADMKRIDKALAITFSMETDTATKQEKISVCDPHKKIESIVEHDVFDKLSVDSIKLRGEVGTYNITDTLTIYLKDKQINKSALPTFIEELECLYKLLK